MRGNECTAAWWDREAGPVVRPYAMTGGRVPAAARFDVVAIVRAVPMGGTLPPDLQPEHRDILAAARDPITVADLAAELDLALGVVQVLLHDLAGQELISLHQPRTTALPDQNVLKAVVNGLRAP